MSVDSSPVTGVAAGVPFVALPPATRSSASSAVVIAWHLMDPPRTEAAFAAALPLGGLDAWRVYFGLPLNGSRMPAGGPDELMRLALEDGVLNLQRPVIYGAALEFEEAFADLRHQFGIGTGPVGLMGGSMGAAVALLVLAESKVEVSAAVLVSPLVQLRHAVEAMGRRFGTTYAWSQPSIEVARRLDFVARAGEVAEHGHKPAILLIVGDNDDPGIVEPAKRLHEALGPLYSDRSRLELVAIPGMGHALADEPGTDPAPQTKDAAVVDDLASQWLRRFLDG
jgi:dienelactone hydrolase